MNVLFRTDIYKCTEAWGFPTSQVFPTCKTWWRQKLANDNSRVEKKYMVTDKAPKVQQNLAFKNKYHDFQSKMFGSVFWVLCVCLAFAEVEKRIEPHAHESYDSYTRTL